jgi:hypothetical protein
MTSVLIQEMIRKLLPMLVVTTLSSQAMAAWMRPRRFQCLCRRQRHHRALHHGPDDLHQRLRRRRLDVPRIQYRCQTRTRLGHGVRSHGRREQDIAVV